MSYKIQYPIRRSKGVWAAFPQIFLSVPDRPPNWHRMEFRAITFISSSKFFDSAADWKMKSTFPLFTYFHRSQSAASLFWEKENNFASEKKYRRRENTNWECVDNIYCDRIKEKTKKLVPCRNRTCVFCVSCRYATIAPTELVLIILRILEVLSSF